jgi:hypothetical protein
MQFLPAHSDGTWVQHTDCIYLMYCNYTHQGKYHDAQSDMPSSTKLPFLKKQITCVRCKLVHRNSVVKIEILPFSQPHNQESHKLSTHQ